MVTSYSDSGYLAVAETQAFQVIVQNGKNCNSWCELILFFGRGVRGGNIVHKKYVFYTLGIAFL